MVMFTAPTSVQISNVLIQTVPVTHFDVVSGTFSASFDFNETFGIKILTQEDFVPNIHQNERINVTTSNATEQATPTVFAQSGIFRIKADPIFSSLLDQ